MLGGQQPPDPVTDLPKPLQDPTSRPVLFEKQKKPAEQRTVISAKTSEVLSPSLMQPVFSGV